MNDARYYYADEDRQPVGPFTFDDLKKLRQQNLISAQTLACPDGGSEWVTVETLIGEAPSLSTKTPDLPKTAPEPTPPSEPVQAPDQAPNAAPDKLERNAVSSAITAVLLPAIAIVGVVYYARFPMFFRVPFLGPGVLAFMAAITLLGFINGLRLLRVKGIVKRRPLCFSAALIGTILCFVSGVLLALVAMWLVGAI